METSRNIDDIVAMLLQFLHTISDWVGGSIAAGIESILSSVRTPASLASSIGLLAVVSALLGLAEVAKKIVWIVVLVGWVLVAIRLVMIFSLLSKTDRFKS